jgi:hypothetical protein
MKKKIAGVDYSLTSPAICVYTTENDDRLFDFDGCDCYYLLASKRQRQSPAWTHGLGNLHPEEYPNYENDEERHEKLASWAYRIVQGCSEVYLEGYAFATSGVSHVRSMAENTGHFKQFLWKNKIKFTSIPPTVIKKFATDRGNSNKEGMYEAFIAEFATPSDLKERLTPKAKSIKNPVSDIVDSYFICKYGHNGFL